MTLESEIEDTNWFLVIFNIMVVVFIVATWLALMEVSTSPVQEAAAALAAKQKALAALGANEDAAAAQVAVEEAAAGQGAADAANKIHVIFVVALGAFAMGAVVGFLYSTFGEEETRFKAATDLLNAAVAGFAIGDLTKDDSLIKAALDSLAVAVGLDGNVGLVSATIVSFAVAGFFLLYINKVLVLNLLTAKAAKELRRVTTEAPAEPTEAQLVSSARELKTMTLDETDKEKIAALLSSEVSEEERTAGLRSVELLDEKRVQALRSYRHENDPNKEELRNWMDSHELAYSFGMFLHHPGLFQMREKCVKDLNIP